MDKENIIFKERIENMEELKKTGLNEEKLEDISGGNAENEVESSGDVKLGKCTRRCWVCAKPASWCMGDKWFCTKHWSGQ